MTLLSVIISIAVLGLVVYLITTYVPMPDIFRRVIYIVALVVLLLYLLRVFGIADITVPRVH